MKASDGTILIIEDESTILEATAMILSDEGYNVLTADSGFAALDVLKNHSKPNLILLDMVMPKMNGWDFAKEYARLYECRAPIVVISGAADVAQRAREIGAVSWLSKPYSIDDLLACVQRFVSP